MESISLRSLNLCQNKVQEVLRQNQSLGLNAVLTKNSIILVSFLVIHTEDALAEFKLGPVQECTQLYVALAKFDYLYNHSGSLLPTWVTFPKVNSNIILFPFLSYFLLKTYVQSQPVNGKRLMIYQAIITLCGFIHLNTFWSPTTFLLFLTIFFFLIHSIQKCPVTMSWEELMKTTETQYQ